MIKLLLITLINEQKERAYFEKKIDQNILLIFSIDSFFYKKLITSYLFYISQQSRPFVEDGLINQK
ncbi:hypothetical protein A8F95_11245 [Bacillus wudalianchiensis]|uniref:Uncharacterized protein n=1 Tax=Pseudobacillus wudalianchiensis TaxID=1743143 RepID=A0A1B9AN29_9BACI|nr:hypothetical protein A8F95_11245 [Bacillus wudalianchiensis]